MIWTRLLTIFPATYLMWGTKSWRCFWRLSVSSQSSEPTPDQILSCSSFWGRWTWWKGWKLKRSSSSGSSMPWRLWSSHLLSSASTSLWYSPARKSRSSKESSARTCPQIQSNSSSLYWRWSLSLWRMWRSSMKLTSSPSRLQTQRICATCTMWQEHWIDLWVQN